MSVAHGFTRPSGFLCLIAAGLLMGCDGDDGSRGPAGPIGPPGPPGPPAPVSIGDATDINAAITAVTINSAPVVEFELSNETGRPIVGLPAGSISFAIARLVPGVNGDASRWENYISRVETADGIAPDALASAIQATTENGSNGTLQDNNDGSYVYRFATDVANVPGITYDATLTHRLSFEIRGFAGVKNPVYTFRPSDGSTTGLFTRDIVKIENCNRCHGELAMHGGARFETRQCVLCHNPGSTDQDSGNIVDFKVMIHKIHRGADLPSVAAGGSYVIYGFNENEHDFSHVEFPQDIRNCTNCHDPGDADTPDAENYLTVPTREACGACHDDVNFASGQGHSLANFAATNADCTTCHGEGAFVGAIDESHALLAQEAAEQFKFNVIGITGTNPGDLPAVTFSITDPTNMDAPYDIQTDAPFTQAGGASRIAIDIGWDTRDYNNEGSQSATASVGTPAQPISLDPLFGGAIETGNNIFTITSTVPLPGTVAGSGVVLIEGHPALDLDADGSVDRIPATSAAGFFAITDTAAVPRRQVVDIAKCNNCHQRLSMHGNNRTSNIDVCVTCHNPNATDIVRREQAGVDASTAPDGKDEQATDFKRMIHAMHGAAKRENDFIVYGFGGSEHNFGHLEFPGILNNCETCHVEDAYYPVGPGVQATTIDTGADRSTAYDDINITPNAAVCSACHDTSLAQVHMEQNGAAWDVVQAADGIMNSMSRGAVTETCAICHGPGRIADIEVVHGFE